MNFESGLSADPNATGIQSSIKSVLIFTAFALAAVPGVLWLSQFFSDGALQIALDSLSWCVVGLLATFVLMASVKVIDSLLNV